MSGDVGERAVVGPAIEALGIINRFGSQTVHDGLDMSVVPGEVFGIVGGSGSGKSVLLRTILGLHRPQDGEVRFFGTDLTRLSDRELRVVKAQYGVTFQAGALFSSLTVLQNVQLPMIEHLQLPPRALDELAMLKAAWKFPAQLSGGMVKRAALARALALDPRLLFLDEPTSGLDPIGAASFDELVMGLQRELALTIVMITHDLDSIFRTCNRVGVIVDRKMVSGTLAQIAEHPHPWIQSYFHGDRARRFEVSHGA
jgi:phospholipid/cholesterol/gamma-HCH transport system ATP-binding protein